MAAEKNPFDILGINASAEDVVINAAYKALARRYHPDMNPGVAPAELDARMKELNWAKDELERDRAVWRSRAPAAQSTHVNGTARSGKCAPPSGSSSGVGTPAAAIEVDQQVLFLTGYPGATASFRASVAEQSATSIRARFREGVIELERLASSDAGVSFRVTVRRDFTAPLADSVVEMIDLVAPGCIGAKVFASIQPLTAEAMQQRPALGRIAPARFASPDALISFGKHRGTRFREIAIVEPGYLHWMLREGAGSLIEQSCARLALAEVEARTTLPSARQSRRARVQAVPAQSSESVSEPAKPLALPDPNRPGGFFRALKGMFGSRRT